jgi:hypothetical protein
MNLAATENAFANKYFTAMKSMPDLATQVSVGIGVPLCTMTTERHEVAMGERQPPLAGQAGRPTPVSIKAQLQDLVMSMTSEDYSKPPDYV